MTDDAHHSSLASGTVIALCGGIGGAKLALGLYRLLAANLTIVVNTADDFEHLGLQVSPDLDTVLYTLASLNDPERGWGRRDETWNFMAAIREIGAEDWFMLGDKDLALHVARSCWLSQGQTLSEVTRRLCLRLGVDCNIVPMSNGDVRTYVDTPEGLLSFQHYFVKRRCDPAVRDIQYVGAADAEPTFLDMLGAPGLRAVIVCPSNPYLSIGPLLALQGARDALVKTSAPVVAVSPIIRGAAVKGPTAKIMAELGVSANSAAVADYYKGLIDGLVVDEADSADIASLDVACRVTRTLMSTIGDRIRLPKETLEFADRLRTEKLRRRHSTDIRNAAS